METKQRTPRFKPTKTPPNGNKPPGGDQGRSTPNGDGQVHEDKPSLEERIRALSKKLSDPDISDHQAAGIAARLMALEAQLAEEQEAERKNNPTEADQIEARIAEITDELADLGNDAHKDPRGSDLVTERQKLRNKLGEIQAQAMIDTGDYISVTERLLALGKLDAAQWAKTEMATRGLELPPAVDINDLEDEDADYLVDGYLQLGTVGYLVAKYGAGKSFLVLDWACCIATGRKWLDRETRPGRVIYIAAEGAGGQAKRFKAWVQEHENVPDGTLLMIKKPIQLGSVHHVDHLVDLVIEQQADLVIIDTLARSMLGLDESRDGAIITAALDRIRDARGERMTTVLPYAAKSSR